MTAFLLNLLALDKGLSSDADYKQLFRQLQQAIIRGDLKGGTRLPATRELARNLGIARNTVKTAYEMLIAEGYVESRVGAGSFVVELPAQLLRKPEQDAQKRSVEINVSRFAEQFRGLSPLNPGQRRALQPAIPALDQFPLNRWKSCLGKAASRGELAAVAPAGDIRLRQQISRYLLKERAIDVSEEQILITSGSQQGAFMVAQLLTNSGDTVLVETPGFPGTAGVFKTVGCKVDTIDFEADQQLPSAKLISLTPSRNFPLGHTLSLEKRLEVIRWAEENNSWILEDDYDSEFASGRPVSSLFSVCESARVIYTGTFSRSMFPALRLGYIVLPITLTALFTQARRYMDGGLSHVAQIAMAEFMQQSYFYRHLKKMRELYQQRRDLMLKVIAKSELSGLPLLGAEGGMHLVLGLPESIDEKQLVTRLSAENMGVRALSTYDLGPGNLNGLVIGFCAESGEAIEQGISIISHHYKTLRENLQ
ncbi:PLP-dependent aminotransferase family protein [Neptuniibacter sp.]|uniref:MocR-like pyridoxine biosynthesis transcription factor PdxR n=1 Tax=Neptuniibacter sp. TaxID=1962643 RepID=UPI0026285E8A|nr:PLP-dependent aminotransferase family protein [Neptuniibacter sp.]MCP4595240.1 PLP-dependent aminotransferase family protein [Neptuniibacter sp.]